MADEHRNPIVFFDVQIAGQEVGRVKLELFADTCPKTAENFRFVCGAQSPSKEITNQAPSRPAGSSAPAKCGMSGTYK